MIDGRIKFITIRSFCFFHIINIKRKFFALSITRSICRYDVDFFCTFLIRINGILCSFKRGALCWNFCSGLLIIFPELDFCHLRCFLRFYRVYGSSCRTYFHFMDDFVKRISLRCFCFFYIIRINQQCRTFCVSGSVRCHGLHFFCAGRVAVDRIFCCSKGIFTVIWLFIPGQCIVLLNLNPFFYRLFTGTDRIYGGFPA